MRWMKCLMDLKNMVEGNNKMVIDPNPFDDTDGVVNGEESKSHEN